MNKPHDILNRDREWAKLTELWESGSAELVFITGRRRVGKSWLLQRFVQAVGGIYYQATRGSREEQISRLTRIMGHHFDDPALKVGAELPDWESLLRYITQRAGGRPFLFALDEFPYLAEEDRGLTSLLQLLWDHLWKEGGTFKLVLCGSHTTFMQQLEERDQPLHGRRTARIAISPFVFRDVEAFVPFYDRRDQLRTYGIFGGLPGHLDEMDPNQDLGRNVARMILDPSARLHDEALHLLDAFGKGADVHYSALSAVATGAHTWGEIKNRVDRSEGALWPVLEWLQGMELLEREVPATKDRPSRSKVSIYRVTDPYLSFWYRFVEPLYSSGSTGLGDPANLWTHVIEPRLDDYMGNVFEDVCRDAVRAGLPLPFKPLRVGRWWTRDGRNEVDVVARGARGELFLGECKWGSVTRADLDLLQERSRLVMAELPNVSTLTYGLFSASDRKDEGVARAAESGEVLYFPAEALFRVP